MSLAFIISLSLTLNLASATLPAPTATPLPSETPDPGSNFTAAELEQSEDYSDYHPGVFGIFGLTSDSTRSWYHFQVLTDASQNITGLRVVTNLPRDNGKVAKSTELFTDLSALRKKIGIMQLRKVGINWAKIFYIRSNDFNPATGGTIRVGVPYDHGTLSIDHREFAFRVFKQNSIWSACFEQADGCAPVNWMYFKSKVQTKQKKGTTHYDIRGVEQVTLFSNNRAEDGWHLSERSLWEILMLRTVPRSALLHAIWLDVASLPKAK